MEERLVIEILQSATEYLSLEQLEKLQNTLYIKLHDYEIKEICTDLTISTDGNYQLLDMFLATKRVEGRADSTLKYYNYILTRMIDNVNKLLKEITTNDLRYYLAIYKKDHDVNNITIDNMRRIFTSFFGWLTEEEYIRNNPAKRLKKTKIDKLIKEPLSDEQLEKIRCNCEKERDLAIVDFMYSTGVRVSELVALNRTDINFVSKDCIVMGKGSKQRKVYLNAKASLHLKSYLLSRTDGNPALFVTCKSPYTRLTKGGIESIIRNLGRKAGIEKVHPHRFRRTMATDAMNRGMPVQEVSILLGHQSIETTMIYCVVNQNSVKASHERCI
ncbi:site-specific tyrosine recombinase/integron integrase [Diplocloster modestus]|uniref:Tyrosine-type recombinase/integrase n=1 Tax=Diplocloster modestus TaxID=2850322 RepID=A0ABS6KCR0_9FIRM|nr:site-specific tyrosine recombinase/integron integrase [Diplocloster modestus]MBU9728302.1 tyrosine-type recombinase/integrase [Diplocloster modestus]